MTLEEHVEEEVKHALVEMDARVKDELDKWLDQHVEAETPLAELEEQLQTAENEYLKSRRRIEKRAREVLLRLRRPGDWTPL
jgi:hypothetical protein